MLMEKARKEAEKIVIESTYFDCYNFSMRLTIKKISLKDADSQDVEFWRKKSPEEKLDTLQQLREIYYQFKNESRKGFQRVYRIIKQK